MKPHTFCHSCGAKYEVDAWPRVCGACHGTTYRNPIPVVVVLVPVENGLLVGKRGINPGYGKLAHTAGYMELGESWQQAAARELHEETGLLLVPEFMYFHSLEMAGNGNVLIFCQTPPLVRSAFDGFVPNDEVLELVVITEPTELAFQAHTKVADAYFASKSRESAALRWPGK
jgi:ADP-ribose pyrophosphatase YjhB (NUDIX family)